ncbi:MAG: alpha/beta hydrolase, partial [Holophagales bacterium]|nr:alpha/beta hydrolase [Holophagales bacterium]
MILSDFESEARGFGRRPAGVEPGPRAREGRWRSPALLAGLLALFLGGTALSGSAGPARADDRVDLMPCHLPGLEEQILCGELDVYENPDSTPSRRISLDIAVVPARAAQPAAEPLFVLAGGPGQAATDLVAMVSQMLDGVRRQRDLVFVDQRGTGGSNPLHCELGDPIDLFAATAFPTERITECRDTLSRLADLKLYTTFHAMPDLDRVRRALGYERIALWGSSYGTRAALVYASLFPRHTHALVLDGTAPFEV